MSPDDFRGAHERRLDSTDHELVRQIVSARIQSAYTTPVRPGRHRRGQ